MSLPTLEEAVEEVGFEFPRTRKLECPKHEDKTPSLHLYEDSWYCFACGAHGDGIGLVAHYTNQDVRRLLAQRGSGDIQRRATRGMSKTDVGRAVVRRRRELLHWWFGEISVAYADSKEWALLRAVDLWTDVFDELTDRITGTGLWDSEEKLPPYEAEQAIDELRLLLEQALPMEQAEGVRTLDV